MTDTITLTREQWNEVWDGLDHIREAASDGQIFDITAALSTIGLNKPAEAIDGVQDAIVDETLRLQRILVAADDTQPAPAKPRAMPKWWLAPITRPLKHWKGRA